MNLTDKSLANWKLLLSALLLAGWLVFFASQRVAHAQTDCIDPATGLPCAPTPGPTCGLPGLPPCEPPPPSGCTDAAGNPCTPVPPPPSKPDPTRTPRPLSTRTPTPTVTFTSTTTVLYLPTLPPWPTLVPGITPQPTPTRRPSFDGVISTIKSNLASKPPPFIRWVFAEGNLVKITNAEITQAIQCLDNPNCSDNSVPLVTGKLSLVRVYARVPKPSIGAIYNIGGVLCPGDTGENGCADPIRPLRKIVVYNLDHDFYKNKFGNQRADLNLTLNFLVPTYMLNAGTQQFTAYINYNLEDRAYESVYKDNHFLITAEVRQSKPLGLNIVLVQDHGEMANANAVFPIWDYIKASFPTSIVNFHLNGFLIGKNYEWNVANNSACQVKGWGDLHFDLYKLRGGYKEIYYGLVPDAGFSKAEGNTYGCGLFPSWFVGGGLSSPLALKNQATSLTFIPKLTAHELGHNVGLRHAPGCSAGGPDSTFPTSNGNLDEVGVNVAKMRLYLPMNTFDFMGYCGKYEEDAWVSVHNTYKLLSALPKGVYEPPQLAALEPVGLVNTPDKVIIASGYIDPLQAIVNGGIFTMEGSNAPEVTPNEGDYIVTFLDAEGKEAYSQNFAVMVGEAYGATEEVPAPGGSFVLVLPWQEGVKEVVFSHQGTELSRIKASKNSPTVAFISPIGGENWGTSGEQTVSWQSEDKDGDLLTYTLQISRDNGASWDTMNPNMTETSLQFDTSFVAGAEQAIFRVLASDGLNTSEAVSLPISIEHKVPVLNIEGPLDGTQVEQGNAILIYAQAIDLQDGSLDSSAFTWTSDRDGELGVGDQLVVQDLTLGVHTLTVDVVNNAGLHAQQRVNIEIIPAQPVQVEYEQISISPVLWVMLVLGVVIAALLVVLVVVWRKTRQ